MPATATLPAASAASPSPSAMSTSAPPSLTHTHGSSMGAAAPVSPGLAAQLEAQFRGLALDTAVAWCAAVKRPGSRQVLLVGSDTDGSWEEADVDTWLQTRLLHQGWRGWVCYNDKPPDIKAGAKFGHCKGILAWSPARLGWLVHSIPDWPKAFSDTALSPLVRSSETNGQSFVWVSLKRTPELTKEICRNVTMMNPCVYLASVTADEEKNVWPFGEARFGTSLPVPPSQPPTLVQLAPGMWHLAKHGGWSRTRQGGRPTGLDFYEDALAITHPFTGTWRVQTWLNGKADVERFGSTDNVDNVLQIRLPDSVGPHRTTKDHGKWGVHRDRPLVVIGDLNRTSDQTKRGGGGIVIEDARLWDSFGRLIDLLEAPWVEGAAVEQPGYQDARASMQQAAASNAVEFQGASSGQFSGGSGGLSALVEGTPVGLGASGRRRVGTLAGSGSVGGSVGGSMGGSMGSMGQSMDASWGADSATSAHSKCNCGPGNCGRGRCGCKRGGHECSDRCKCRGQCSYTAQLAEAAGPATDEAESAREQAAPEAPKAPAEPSPQLAAMAAAIPNLMQAAAMAAAMKSGAPALQLLNGDGKHDSQQEGPAEAAPAPALNRQQGQAAAAPAPAPGQQQGPAAAAPAPQQPPSAAPAVSAFPAASESGTEGKGGGGSKVKQAAASAGADGGAGATSAACGCKPENCGRFRCACKGHACSARCACEGLCAHSMQAAAAGEAALQVAVAAPAAPLALDAEPMQQAGVGAPAAQVSGRPAAAPAAAAASKVPTDPPLNPVAAMGAAFQRVMHTAAVAAGALAASRVSPPHSTHQHADGPSADAAEAAPEAAGAAVERRLGGGAVLTGPAGSKQSGAAAASHQGCKCAKGCRDKRCSCQRAGQTATAMHAPLAAFRVAPCSRSTLAPAGRAAAAQSMLRPRARPSRAARPAIQAFQGVELQTERATVPVTFVMNHKTLFAQEVFLVGSAPQLGGWVLESAVKLTWTEGDAWTAAVELPAGAELEYKFVVTDKRHGAFWECCPNRQLSVASSSTHLIGGWEAPFVAPTPAAAAQEQEKNAQEQGAAIDWEAAQALTKVMNISMEGGQRAGCEAVTAAAAATGAALAERVAETSAVLEALIPASTRIDEQKQAAAPVPARSARKAGKAGNRRGAAALKLSPQAEAEVEAVIAANQAGEEKRQQEVQRQQSPVAMGQLASAVKGFGRPAVARTASMGFAPVKPAGAHAKPAGTASKSAAKRPSFRPKLAAPSPKPAAPEPAAPDATPFFPSSASSAASAAPKAGGAKSGRSSSAASSSPAADVGAGKAYSPEQIAFLQRAGKL